MRQSERKWIRAAKRLFMAMLLASMVCSGNHMLQADASALPEESGAAVPDDYRKADAKGSGEITNPVYNSDTKSSTYSYVYFGHYPQSEITGDDLTEDIVHANYTRVGGNQAIGIADHRQVFRFEIGEENGQPVYAYYLVEPIKWKVLSVDDNYMTLMSDRILDHGIYYSQYGYASSAIRSWLNGYDGSCNDDNSDFAGEFLSFVNCAFTRDEYDLCQLQSCLEGKVNDCVILPDDEMVRNNAYGFYEEIGASSTRVKKATDYARICAAFAEFSKEYDGWYTADGVVSSSGSMSSYASVFGISPVIKILKDSSLYSTEKPELSMGEDISGSICSLKYDSVNYDGTGKCPEVTVEKSGQILTKDLDYTVDYRNNLNAGEATVSIKGAGNYFGTVEKKFTIRKLGQEISGVNASYRFQAKGETLKLYAVSSGNGSIEYVSSDEGVVVAAPRTGRITVMGPGIATIKVTASETLNYLKGEKNIDVVVQPEQVGGLSVKGNSSNAVSVQWNKVPGASGYEVYKYHDLYEEYILVDTVPANQTDYKFDQLSSGTKYKFKVRAFTDTARGKLYGASAKCTASTKTANPSNPKTDDSAAIKKVQAVRAKIKSAKNIRAKKIKLKLSGSAGCDGYQIQYSAKKNFKSAKKLTRKSGSVTLKGLKKRRTYYVRVRVYKAIHNNMYYGKWSKTKAVKVRR